jgi:hypothetical protein
MGRAKSSGDVAAPVGGMPWPPPRPPPLTDSDVDGWWAEQTQRAPARFQVWSWSPGDRKSLRVLLERFERQADAIGFAVKTKNAAVFDNREGLTDPVLKVGAEGELYGPLKDAAELLTGRASDAKGKRK